jgi:DNA topoisomerase-1
MTASIGNKDRPAAVWLFEAEQDGQVLDFTNNVEVVVDSREAADLAGLRYVSDDKPGIRRRRSGKGFVYLRPNGARLTDGEAIRRLKSLAVPPAWTEVWISPSAEGHIQATGRDAKGRKQYRYHPAFRAVREGVKFEHMLAFADALPTIRAKVAKHMAQPGLGRDKVLATVVHLLENTLIRVGNDDYAKHNDSYGLTTLENRHVAIAGSESPLSVHRQERKAMVAEAAGSSRDENRPRLPGVARTGIAAIFRR